MKATPRFEFRRRPRALACLGLLLLLGLGAAAPGSAAGNLVIGPADGAALEYDFGPVGTGTGTPVGVEDSCPPSYCDAVNLSVVLPAPTSDFYAGHRASLSLHFKWDNSVPTDIEGWAYSPSGAKYGPSSPSDTSSGFGNLVINDPEAGAWKIEVAASVTPRPTPVHASLLLHHTALPPLPTVIPRPSDPHFVNYPSPIQTFDGASRPNGGEPSIGADWSTGAIMYMAGAQISRINFDDSVYPARAAWKDVTAPQLSVINEDEGMFVDRVTHRTFAAGLYLACSLMAFSDDDGATWNPSEGCSPGAAFDHETVGGGPFAAPGRPTGTYPHEVYYCAQDGVMEARCGVSTDGGTLFTPAATVWQGACNPLHGHLRVGYDGTAYLPDASCQGHQGLAVSTDNSATWSVHVIPDSVSGTSDPSVDAGPDGTVYMGFADGRGHPLVAVSHDHGSTWAPSIDVGQFKDPSQTEDGLPHGIQNTEFSEVITGDAGRAAFAFLGTGTGGDYQASGFRGTWYMYISYTYDGGRTWQTYNATPGDPVQRGCIWNGGGANVCRNLLDFNDITVDNRGRVLVGYTDGCTRDCERDPQAFRGDLVTCSSENWRLTNGTGCDRSRLSAVVRQSCGRGLLAAYDAQLLAACPGAPLTGVQGRLRLRALPNTSGGGAEPWMLLGLLLPAVLLPVLPLLVLRRRTRI